MLGMVYTVFADMAEETLGLAGWNALLRNTQTEADGVFTAGALYKDSDLVALIVAYADSLARPVDEVLRDFGCYLFTQLAASHGQLITHYHTLPDLLLAVDGIIHREVKTLYPDAQLPSFHYPDPDTRKVVHMEYRSDRKLCQLAEGLIQGAANHYGTTISILQSQCIHRGDDFCHFEIQMVE